MKKISAFVLSIMVLFIFSIPVMGQLDTCLNLVWQHDPEHGIYNPDSVLIDKCKEPTTFMALKWFVVYFYEDVFHIPSAPYDSVIERNWRDLDTIYASYRNAFQNLEGKYGYFYFRKARPLHDDTIDLASARYHIRFVNLVNIDSVEKDLHNIDSLYLAYYLSNASIDQSSPLLNEPTLELGEISINNYYYLNKLQNNLEYHLRSMQWYLFETKIPIAWEITKGKNDIILGIHDSWQPKSPLTRSYFSGHGPDETGDFFMVVRKNGIIQNNSSEGNYIFNYFQKGNGYSSSSPDGFELVNLQEAHGSDLSSFLVSKLNGNGMVGICPNCRVVGTTFNDPPDKFLIELPDDSKKRINVINQSQIGLKDIFTDDDNKTSYHNLLYNAISKGLITIGHYFTAQNNYPDFYNNNQNPDFMEDYKILGTGPGWDDCDQGVNNSCVTWDYRINLERENPTSTFSNNCRGKTDFNNLRSKKWIYYQGDKYGKDLSNGFDITVPHIGISCKTGGKYERLGGESFSIAHVTGIAGLMLSIDENINCPAKNDCIQKNFYDIVTFTADKVITKDGTSYNYRRQLDEGQDNWGHNTNHSPENPGFPDPLDRWFSINTGYGRINAFRCVAHAIRDKGDYRYETAGIINFVGGTGSVNEDGFNLKHFGAHNESNGWVLQNGGSKYPGEPDWDNCHGTTLINGSNTILTVPNNSILAIDGILKQTTTPLSANKIITSGTGKILVTGYIKEVTLEGYIKVDDLKMFGSADPNNGTPFPRLIFASSLPSEIYGKVVLNGSSKIIVNSGTLTIQPGGSVELNGTQDIEINSGATLEMAYASSIKASGAQKIIIKPGGWLVIKEGAMVHLDCEVEIQGELTNPGIFTFEKNTLVYSDKITLTQYGTLTMNEGAIIMPETGKTGKIVLEEGVNFEVNNSSWTERLALIGGIDVKPGATLRVKEGSKLDLGPFNIEGFIINSNNEVVQGGKFFVEKLSNIKLFGSNNNISGYFETGINVMNETERPSITGFSGDNPYTCGQNNFMVYSTIDIRHQPFIFNTQESTWIFNQDYVNIHNTKFENVSIKAINAITRNAPSGLDISNCSFQTNSETIKAANQSGYLDQKNLPSAFIELKYEDIKKPQEMPFSTWFNGMYNPSNLKKKMTWKMLINVSFRDNNVQNLVYNRNTSVYKNFDGLSIDNLKSTTFNGIGTETEDKILFKNLRFGINTNLLTYLHCMNTYFQSCSSGIHCSKACPDICNNKFENSVIGVSLSQCGLYTSSTSNTYLNTQFGCRLDNSRQSFRGDIFTDFLNGLFIESGGYAYLAGHRGNGLITQATDLGGCIFNYGDHNNNPVWNNFIQPDVQDNPALNSDIEFNHKTGFAYLPCGYNTFSGLNTNLNNYHLSGTENYYGRVSGIYTLNNYWQPVPPGTVRYNDLKVVIDNPSPNNQQEFRSGCVIGITDIGEMCYPKMHWDSEVIQSASHYIDNPVAARAKFDEIKIKINIDSLGLKDRELWMNDAVMLSALADSSEYCLREFIDTLNIIISDTLYPSSHRRSAWLLKGHCYDRLGILDTANIVYNDLIQNFPDAESDVMYAQWQLQYNNCKIADPAYGILYDSLINVYNNRVIDDITRIDVGQPKRSLFENDIIMFDRNENKDEEEMAVLLDQNYPNPFSSLTEIQYFLNKPGHARLSLLDISGKEVARLIDKNVKASWSTLIINGSGLTNGPYLLKLESEGKTAIKHLLRLD